MVHWPLVSPLADLLACLSSTLIYVGTLPITIPLLTGQAAYRTARQMLRPLLKDNVDPSTQAIIITGCDSGFGLSTALQLAAIGHTVFALCYSDETSHDLLAASKTHDKLVRIICDVTKDSHVDAAAASVKEWEASSPSNRVLALVNNAGKATPGIVDLCPLSEFEMDISVCS